MRRALIIDLSRNFGGADIRVAQVANGLSGRFDITIAALAASQTLKRFEADGLSLFSFARTRKDPRLFFDLNRKIASFGPAVVDAHNSQSMLWGLPAAHAAGVPIRIATFHSIFHESENKSFGNYLFQCLYLTVQWHATHIVSVSRAVTDHLVANNFRREAITTIPNGVAVSAHHQSKATDRLKIMFVGRLVPVKGVEFLLQALSLITAVAPDFECDIVGDGPERPRLEDMAQKLGLAERVNFLGYRSNAQNLVASSQLMVMPSLSEGMPFAALEAAAAGVCMVASRVGGLKTYFGDENAAVMVPPSDPRALADAILSCLRDGDFRRAVSARSRELVAKRYSLDGMLSATEHIYGKQLPGSTQDLSVRIKTGVGDVCGSG